MSVYGFLIENFINNLVNKYQYDGDVLRTEWLKINNEIINTIESNTNNTAPIVFEQNCKYKVSRGPKADTICGSKIKQGHILCTKHIKYESKYLSENTQSSKIINKSRVKMMSKKNIQSIPEIVNTCKTEDDENICINFDKM